MKHKIEQIIYDVGLMLLVALTAFGFLNVVFGGNYFDNEVFIEVGCLILIYLMLLWMNTRKHPILAGLIILLISVLILIYIKHLPISETFNYEPILQNNFIFIFLKAIFVVNILDLTEKHAYLIQHTYLIQN